MDISQRGIDLIVSFEGKHTLLPDGRYKAYLDTLAHPPVPTIYCGLTKGVKMGMVATEEECQRLFVKELNIYDNAVDDLVTVPITQNMHDALVSFTYNCGVGALKKSTLLKLLNQGKYEQAAAQFARWNKAGGTVWPGLVRRRAAEAALFLEPMPVEKPREVLVRDVAVPETAMPQRVEESKEGLKEASKSPTILSALAGLGSSIGVGWQWLGSVASDTAAEVVATKQSLTGFEALWSHLGVTLGGVLLVVTIASLGVVLARHVRRYLEGRA